METREPIDLLEGREADVLADWLKEHPGIEVIVRDRGGAYAEGSRQGAPNAPQVADRLHVARNVSGALDEVVKQRPWAPPTDGGREKTGSPAAAGDPGRRAAPAGFDADGRGRRPRADRETAQPDRAEVGGTAGRTRRSPAAGSRTAGPGRLLARRRRCLGDQQSHRAAPPPVR
jgi:hypothetical protein